MVGLTGGMIVDGRKFVLSRYYLGSIVELFVGVVVVRMRCRSGGDLSASAGEDLPVPGTS
jgi:hypothetical protein